MAPTAPLIDIDNLYVANVKYSDLVIVCVPKRIMARKYLMKSNSKDFITFYYLKKEPSHTIESVV